MARLCVTKAVKLPASSDAQGGRNRHRDRPGQQEDHTSQKKLGYALVVVGIVLVVIGVFADSLGLGSSPIFGWKQIAATVVGLVVAVVGLWLAARKTA